MTIYDLKPAFQNLLRPLVDLLAKKNIKPNHITVLAMILSIILGVLIVITNGSTWLLISMPLFLILRMALNAIDGILAKEYNLKSDSGKILNEMGDIISDASLYLPLAFITGVSPVAIVLFVIIGITGETIGILSETLNKSRRYDGPMGKSDRAFIIGLLSLIWGFGIEPSIWSDFILYFSALLGCIGIKNRWVGALK